jgi:hypothetical protein
MPEPTLQDVMQAVTRIERYLIQQSEYGQLGHRIVYDKRGMSTNVPGATCDPSLIEYGEHDMGVQVRLG